MKILKDSIGTYVYLTRGKDVYTRPMIKDDMRNANAKVGYYNVGAVESENKNGVMKVRIYGRMFFDHIILVFKRKPSE